MHRYFDAYAGEFLNAAESNFPKLLEKLTILHEKLGTQTTEGVPRVPLDKRFRYDELDFTPPRVGKDTTTVFNELAQAFQGSIRWHQPTALVNIIPNPLLDSVAAANMAALYNANAFWDYVSGGLTKLEREVVAFLSYLAGWDASHSEGLSTAGGKATLQYAIRCGLNTCDRQSISQGLTGDYVVITSLTAHYSIEDSCNFLGIGRANVIRVATDDRGAMLPEAFEIALRQSLQAGKKVAAIICLGGDTLEHTVDPIKEIHAIRAELAKEFNLGYTPFLHVDSVNAWVTLAFRDYEFATNPLQIESPILHKIRQLTEQLRSVEYADSFSADFHKTGLAPYISSFFVAKAGAQLHSINKDELLEEKPSYQFGEFHSHHITFENSRPASSIVSAWTSMKRLGIEGYQRYWAQLQAVGEYIRQRIQQRYDSEIKILNVNALGHPNVIKFMPPGFTDSYESLLDDEQAREAYSTYCFELYDYMAYGLLSQRTPYPLLGFVPSYRYEITGVKRPAFLIYLNDTQLSEHDCDRLLEQIINLKHDFERQRPALQHKQAQKLKHLPK